MDRRALKRRSAQQIRRCSTFTMALSTGKPFSGICQRRRQTDRRNDSACGQYTWRWRRTARYPLLLFGLVTFPIIAAASIDYGSLTWSKWNEMYTSASDSTAIPGIYRSGPRVRAKMLISTPISMSDLQTNTAWFRQQIKDFMEVETVDRVLLEYLQTEARSETEQGVYYVAVGISALPPPETMANLVMLSAIEAERGRIAEILKYGKVSTAGNVTISSLWLFGKPMTLVDVVLDGESFTQIYLKPWLGLQLVVGSVNTLSTSRSGHYTINRDAFQDLRLRFLLAKRLASLPVRVSDIIVHSPTEILPFSTYNADAGVLEIELHVNSLQYAKFVEMYLLPGNHSSGSIVQDFNEMEPQWELLAMDIDTKAGELVYPSRGSESDNRTSSVNIPVLTFEMLNVSWTRLERSKDAVLDYIREALASVGICRVRIGRIDFPSAQTNVATFNDGEEAGKSIFDPVNAVKWTLSFIVEPEGATIFDHLVLADRVRSTQSIFELGLQNVLGITDTSTASVEFIGTSNGFDSESTVDPFVSFILTFRVASTTILESPNFFQLHHVRSALVILLQQVAVQNDQVTFVSAEAVDRPSNEPERSWDRLLLVKYRTTISDESQRRGIRSIVFSHRLAATIALYSGETLELIEREIDEGWPIWPQYLPGLFIEPPELNSFSNGFVTSSTTLLKYKAVFVYDFTNPEPSSVSGLVVNSSDVCSVHGTTSPGVCIKLRVTGSTQVAPIFLRKLQSLGPVTSSSIKIPPTSGVRGSSSTYPAPWLSGQNAVGEAWTLLVNSSSSAPNNQNLRLTFAAVYTMEDLRVVTPFTLDLELNPLDTAATLLISRPVGDLAVAATTDEPVPAFISAELPEVTSNGDESTSISITLNLQEPRLGGLYSLEADGTVCAECADLLTDCNSRLECREFSACASALFNDDLTLISTLIQGDTINVVKDVSWLLKDCLTPSDGTVWSSTLSKTLVSSFTCFWQNHCPLVYDHSSNRQLVLVYGHGEQVLTFQLVAGHASLSFTLETTYDFMEDFTTNATTVSAQLDAMLTEMYRAAESNVATVKSTLTTTEEAATGVVTAHLTIQYQFLGRFPLPLVEITHSGSNDAALVETARESLHLVRYPLT